MGGVSLKPSEMTQGGLIDDITVEWVETRFKMFDYNGKVPVAVPALYAKMRDVETDEEHEQYWSMGNAKDWAPDDAEKELVSVGSASSIKTNANGSILLKSLVDAGYPEDKLGADISVLDGLIAHMTQVAAPKRSGLVKAEREDGKKFDDTILIVENIESMPGAKKAAKGKPAAKKPAAKKPAKKKPAPAAIEEEDSDVAAEAIEYVIGAIAEAGEGVPKKTLTTAAFQNLADNPNRQAIVQLIFADDFLGGDDVPWNFEDGIVSM